MLKTILTWMFLFAVIIGVIVLFDGAKEIMFYCIFCYVLGFVSPYIIEIIAKIIKP